MIKSDIFPGITPSYSSTTQAKYDVVSISFGDGYTQRMPRGINNKKIVYSNAWEGLTRLQHDQIVNFIDERGGVKSFWWTPWDAKAQRWTCGGYTVTPKAGDYYDITAEFLKDYDY